MQRALHFFANEAFVANGRAVRESAGFFEYVTMGVIHIFTGVDHMYFLLGLVFISRRTRDLIFVITGRSGGTHHCTDRRRERRRGQIPWRQVSSDRGAVLVPGTKLLGQRHPQAPALEASLYPALRSELARCPISS
jgi:hypothetical protein